MAKAKTKKGPKKICFELKPVSLFLWIMFLLFLLTWVFVLGIFVGRGLLPDFVKEFKNPFSSVTEETAKEEDEYKYKTPEDEESKFDFYDRLESKKNEVKKRMPPPPKKEEPSHEVTLARDETSEPIRKKITATEKDQDQPAVKQQRPEGEFYTVQIASISDRESAGKLVKELVDKGYDAYYYGATVNGKKTYRIMCGKFAGYSEAAETLSRLKKDTGYKGLVKKVDN